MAARTWQPGMTVGQREAAVVKECRQPPGRRVTGTAFPAKAARVNIILGMAGITVRGHVLELTVGMAICA